MHHDLCLYYHKEHACFSGSKQFSEASYTHVFLSGEPGIPGSCPQWWPECWRIFCWQTPFLWLIVRTLVILKKHRNVIIKYFCFNLRSWVWGCFRCPQQVTVIYLVLWQGHDFASCRFYDCVTIVILETLRGYINVTTPLTKRQGELFLGCWLVGCFLVVLDCYWL